MLSIILFGALALAATLPSVLVARLYLRRRGIEVPADQTVTKFMEVAPGPLKAVLISLNFTLFGVGIWLIWQLG